MKIFLLILILSGAALGQIKAVAEGGKEVILKSGGTWSYGPAPDRSTPGVVYIYRLKEDAVYNRATEVSVDGKEVFQIKQGNFAGVKLPPGRHHIRTNKADSEMGIAVSAGERYFVLLVVGAGGLFKTHIFSEVVPALAVLQLKNAVAIDEKQTRAKDFPTVTEKTAVRIQSLHARKGRSEN